MEPAPPEHGENFLTIQPPECGPLPLAEETNALLYILLKEGYTLKFAKSAGTGEAVKCVSVEGGAETISREGLLELGQEFEQMVRLKAARHPGAEVVSLEPKDIFDDGDGAFVEVLDPTPAGARSGCK